MNEAKASQVASGPDTARFAWLLVALVVALAAPPILLETDLPLGSLRIGLSGVLVAALFVVSRRRATLWLGLGLAVPALLLDWASFFTDSLPLAVASSTLAIGFLGLVITSASAVLLRAERVTTDTILGGICVYVLIGLLFVSGFTLVELAEPGSILLGGEPLDHGAASREVFRFTEILYFSFVTLTTLGYGDMVPVTPAARAIAAGESILGQLYLAVFIARLIGLHLAQNQTRD